MNSIRYSEKVLYIHILNRKKIIQVPSKSIGLSANTLGMTAHAVTIPITR